MRRGAWEAVLREATQPEVKILAVSLQAAPGSAVEIMPGPVKIYGVIMHGVGAGTATWRIFMGPGQEILHAKVTPTGRAAATLAPAWVRAAGPLTAEKVAGKASTRTALTVLWAPL